MTDPILLIDTWEYGGAIDEAVLFANGVSGILIRINEGTIPGTWLDKDDNFDAQWAEAKSLIRLIYFVLDPGHTAQENFDWLLAHAPAGQALVAIDVEVGRTGFTPTQYGKLLHDFLALIRTKWRVIIYTGEWFLDLLNPWPVDVDYWWAEYPYALWPDQPQTITWDQLRAKFALFAGPLNADKIPGPLKLWQGTADKFFLPGCASKMDVSRFSGTWQEFIDWADQDISAPPAMPSEMHTEPYPGVKFDKVFRFSSWCHVLTEPADPKYHQHVTPFSMKTVLEDVLDNHAHTGINGGDYTWYNPVGLLVSGGVYFGQQREYEPFVNVAADGKLSIEPWDSRVSKWDSVAGQRFLVLDGAQSPHTSAAWFEVHPRTLIGVRADGRVVKCCVDGRQPGYSLGVNLFDAARIMIEFGCVTAIDIGGGGDTDMVIAGRVVNSPIDEGIPGKERLIGDRILMTISDVPVVIPPEGGAMKTYKILKDVRPRSAPTMTTGDTDPNAPAGTQFDSDLEQVDAITSSHPVMAHVASGPYLGKWFPIAYLGVQYLQVITASPPPAGKAFTLTLDGYKPFAGVLEPV